MSKFNEVFKPKGNILDNTSNKLVDSKPSKKNKYRLMQLKVTDTDLADFQYKMRKHDHKHTDFLKIIIKRVNNSDVFTKKLIKLIYPTNT